MANFSTNQVRQVYVVKAVKDSVEELQDAGDIVISLSKDNDIYFQYCGADPNSIEKSDNIPLGNIEWITAKEPDDLKQKLTKSTVILDPNVNSGEPIPGADYILKVVFRTGYGISEEDSFAVMASAHAFPDDKASDIYVKLAKSLALNLSKYPARLATIYVSDSTEITKDTDISTISDAANIVIEEAPQPWVPGLMQQSRALFTVLSSTVKIGLDEYLWGVVSEGISDKTLPLGQVLADLEIFGMGERGDQYRFNGFPHIIPTKYLVDPSVDYGVLSIQYFYEGDGISAGKSQKTIQLLCDGTTSKVLNKIKGFGVDDSKIKE